MYLPILIRIKLKYYLGSCTCFTYESVTWGSFFDEIEEITFSSAFILVINRWNKLLVNIIQSTHETKYPHFLMWNRIKNCCRLPLWFNTFHLNSRKQKLKSNICFNSLKENRMKKMFVMRLIINLCATCAQGR